MKQAHQELVFPADHPVFAGHFPGNPIVPGACLLTAAAALVRQQWGAADITIVRVKFRHSLRPDEACHLSLTMRDDGLLALDCRRGDEIVASGLLRLEQKVKDK